VPGSRLRDRDDIALDLVGVAGLAALAIGLLILRTSKELGFDVDRAIQGVLGQLPVTLPAAALVLAATGLELAAGLAIARAARRTPFDSLAEAALAAFTAVVLKDALVLGLLGGLGLLRAPILLGLDAVVLAGAFLPSISGRIRPMTSITDWRSRLTTGGSVPLLALVLIVWSGPVILQLASPVVPFIDVLPNYVAPAEHVSTFGWFSPLSATQSPIIGPSRNVLGYVGLLGTITTMTGLPAVLSIAAFALPLTILAGVSAHRLATVLRGGDPAVGPWALLAFALSQPFARLADARGTVVVLPLAFFGLALVAEALAERRGEAAAAAEHTGDPTLTDAWLPGRAVVAGLAFGAAILVHPVIGFFAVATVALVALVRPRALAVEALIASITAGLVALPQLGTMLGWPLPTISLAVALVVAAALGFGIHRAARAPRVREPIVRLVAPARWPVVIVLIGAAVVGFSLAALRVSELPNGLGETVDLLVIPGGILLAALVAGWLIGSVAARSPLVVVGIGVGLAAVLISQILPRDLGFLGDALRFELPKTVDYWIPALAAVGAGPALALLWTTPRVAWIGRVLAVGAFVVIAALPLRPAEIDAYHLGEHRYAESLAIDLKYAGSGFWIGFPDSRQILDAPRRELVDAARAEIEAGAIGHDTPVLHVAASFQQWSSTPLGVFTGIAETSVSLKPEVSHQTVGGRLWGFDDLPGFLASGGFPYVVLEPDELPDGTRDSILTAGYQSIFSNSQGELLKLRR
jgi:hypothetical protein